MAKSVLITGCSSGGIGSALVRSFAARGLSVFATARDLASMADLEQLPNVHLLKLDVTSPTSVVEAVEAVKDKNGSLHYLVNNAGRGYWLPTLDMDIDEGKMVMDVNFWGQLRAIQGFAPLLITSKGSIVNIGSINGFLNRPYSSIYSASKAGLHVLGEILRVELAPFGVKVLTVVTGFVESSIHDKLPPPKLPVDSIYSPLKSKLEDIASAKNEVEETRADVYAEGVVDDVLAGKNGLVWHAKGSSLVRYGHAILPQFVIDHKMTSDSGLETLKNP